MANYKDVFKHQAYVPYYTTGETLAAYNVRNGCQAANPFGDGLKWFWHCGEFSTYNAAMDFVAKLKSVPSVWKNAKEIRIARVTEITCMFIEHVKE